MKINLNKAVEVLQACGYECEEIESLRQQLADMTADRDRLLSIMCEIAGSKSLTATPTQFYQHLQRIASDATITNPEALAATEGDLAGLIVCEKEPVVWIGQNMTPLLPYELNKLRKHEPGLTTLYDTPLYRAWEPK